MIKLGLFSYLVLVHSIEFTVSGFSSGAFMAMQLHLAHSSSVTGVGISAGASYRFSQGLLPELAYFYLPSLINVNGLVEYAQVQEMDFNIDPLENLKNSRVWVHGSKNDEKVYIGLVKKVEEFYRLYTSNIKTVYNLKNKHAFVTDDYGNPCWFYGKPYISNCNFDMAGDILNHLYDNLKPKRKSDPERLFKFVQSKYDSYLAGMADSGYIYLPEACEAKDCRVHVFLHGCGMNTDYISDALIRYSGFNDWGESNELIIIYPQAARHHPLNYGACWDYSGPSDPDYDTKKGKQISVLYKIVQDIKYIIENLSLISL